MNFIEFVEIIPGSKYIIVAALSTFKSTPFRSYPDTMFSIVLVFSFSSESQSSVMHHNFHLMMLALYCESDVFSKVMVQFCIKDSMLGGSSVLSCSREQSLYVL